MGNGPLLEHGPLIEILRLFVIKSVGCLKAYDFMFICQHLMYVYTTVLYKNKGLFTFSIVSFLLDHI